MSTSHFPNYPAFEKLFQRTEKIHVPLYLTLLDVSNGGQSALECIREVLQNDAELAPQIIALLDDVNWRPHLVGGAAMALGDATNETRHALWQAFDSASWVSPQLAAVAFLVDNEFEQKARSRIEKMCPINSDRLQELDWVQRHSAAGPSSLEGHSSKALSTLTALCQRLPNSWLSDILARTDVQRSIESDHDGGGAIATKWLDDFSTLKKKMV